MADPLAEVAETCRCGASTTVKAPTLDDARAQVAEWRDEHRCDPVDERDRGRSGAGTILAGGPQGHRTGFAAPEVLGPYRWQA